MDILLSLLVAILTLGKRSPKFCKLNLMVFRYVGILMSPVADMNLKQFLRGILCR
jgi:hypothetical protein